MYDKILKLIILISLTIALTVLLSVNIESQARENNRLMIINQIRGSDFASQTLIDDIKYLLSNSQTKKIPIFYAVRYDAIMNDTIAEMLKKHGGGKMGIIVEITLSLASDAGVPYRGNDDNWYKAQNLFTIGYNIDERQKIIDTFKKRRHTF